MKQEQRILSEGQFCIWMYFLNAREAGYRRANFSGLRHQL
jgi:hypothetical protein